MFRFFIQPQLNTVAQSVLGYELLIKQYRDGAWRMPKSFSAIPAKTMADTLIATVKELSLKVGSVSVNVDRHQIQDQHLIHALIMAQAVLRPVKLVIELIEDAVNPAVTNQELIPTVQNLNDLGIQFCLDDVGSGINTWPEIKSLLPYTSELKYALQNYKEHLSETNAEHHVAFWQKIAAEHKMRFILEGIEDDQDGAWADRMKIDLRQGYYYGKPALMKIYDSDPD
ncbi:EAL domain-containing protein [Pediococcus acidilactici]|uniref:EAL domain-containing protein n=1 Tax=Pediococcus acidilactici TaxID=1254 RepID=UPI001330A5B9|nr:EAL domain-containing protein [Pediococcus acidilactici]KAF0380197.1 EAL domain-containing protein [Pediococcus acidilactici]KAF0550762.1 EAL domain-containing protein [Pediococcus acidilactici]